MNDIAAVMADPQVRARNMLVELALRSGDGLLTAASPVKVADAGEVRATPASALDEHREALLRELGLAIASKT
jgi:CoA:oxalate CoA-transferase